MAIYSTVEMRSLLASVPAGSMLKNDQAAQPVCILGGAPFLRFRPTNGALQVYSGTGLQARLVYFRERDLFPDLDLTECVDLVMQRWPHGQLALDISMTGFTCVFCPDRSNLDRTYENAGGSISICAAILDAVLQAVIGDAS